MGSPGGKDLLPSTRFTQETEENILGSSSRGRASATVFVPEHINCSDYKEILTKKVFLTKSMTKLEDLTVSAKLLFHLCRDNVTEVNLEQEPTPVPQHSRTGEFVPASWHFVKSATQKVHFSFRLCFTFTFSQPFPTLS